MSTESAPLKVLVTGPTGTGGRVVVKTLLDRGHFVSGFSRNPANWGTHPRYTPIKGTQAADLPALQRAVEGHDVVVNCFAPSHSTGYRTYVDLVEGAWRLKDAVRKAKSKPYFIYVGGAGSLLDPENDKVTLDEGDVIATKYIVKGPIEHLNWLAPVIGEPMFKVYAYIRDYAHSNGWFSWLPRLLTNKIEQQLPILFNDGRTMPHACRANVGLFEHDESFNWSFVSPPWFYRTGPATGSYGTVLEYQPVDEKGRWLGINSEDFAAAVVDEVEGQTKKWTHWSAFAKQPDTAYYYDDYPNLQMTRFDKKQ